MRIKTRLNLSASAVVICMIFFGIILLGYSRDFDQELYNIGIADEIVKEITDMLIISNDYLVFRHVRHEKQWLLKFEQIQLILQKDTYGFFSQSFKQSLLRYKNSFFKVKTEINHYRKLQTSDASLDEITKSTIFIEALSGQMRLESSEILATVFKLSRDIKSELILNKRKNLIFYMCIMVLIILIVTLASFFSIRRITVPLQALMESALKISEGSTKFDVPFEILDHHDEIGELAVVFDKMTTYLVESMQKVNNSLREKDVLLQELHHRVKNNLQMISGIFELEKDYVSDKQFKKLCDKVQARLYAIAQVHRYLYKSKNLARVGFHSYIHNLLDFIADMIDTGEKNISIDYHIHDIELNLNVAIPCGLIINELVINAYKHAFTDRDTGVITISFLEEHNHYLLIIQDNGRGYRNSGDFFNPSGLGLLLVHSLVRQINGNVELETKNGSSVIIRFKNELYNGPIRNLS